MRGRNRSVAREYYVWGGSCVGKKMSKNKKFAKKGKLVNGLPMAPTLLAPRLTKHKKSGNMIAIHELEGEG